MNATKKSVNKWLGLVLAIAMVFSLNVTSMTAKAATDIPKPVEQTVMSTPSGVKVQLLASGATRAVTAKFYTDSYDDASYNDGGLKFIRYQFGNTTELDELNNTTVTITATSVTSTDTSLVINKATDGTFSFVADLRNKAYPININGTDYILAANIKTGTSTPNKDGYVTAATINSAAATITRFVNDDPCAGNPYYTQDKDNLIDWISITNYIQNDNVEKPTDTKVTPLTYTLKDGTTGETTVDLSNGTAKVTIGKYTYTVKASFVAENVFVASPSTFWIDFQELRNCKDADATSLAQAKKIEDGVAAYYKAVDTQKEFPVGTTNMKVLQTILQWCADNNYIDASGTTLGSNVTYVAEINGLGEFSVGSLSGWMYTDNPDSSIAPENWYTAPVSAADYQLAADSKIAWFYTVNYGTHPW